MTLDDARIEEARQVLLKFLSAWDRQALGTMASLLQIKEAEEAQHTLMLQDTLGPQHMEGFEIEMEVDRANGENLTHSPLAKVEQEFIAYVDFRVTLVINGKRKGIRPRVVYDGRKWRVSHHTLSRTFDPKEE